MEEVIAGGILLAMAKLALATIVLSVISAVLTYIAENAWIRWTIGVLVCAVAFITYENAWGYVSDHAASAFGVSVVALLFVSVLFSLWTLALKAYRWITR
jgi:hypothetical protein